jgi:hypothetical protein
MSLLACAAVAAAPIAVAVAPSSGQATQEVDAVIGGAAGSYARVESDLITRPSAAAVNDLIEAAVAEDAAAAADAVATTSLGAAGAPTAEAVIEVGPEPRVTLPAEGGSVADSTATFEIDGLPVAGVADVAANGDLGPTGSVDASATVADVDLFLLGADLVDTSCAADLDGRTGATTLENAGGIISGPFPTDPDPNTLSPFTIDATFPIDIDGTTLTVQYQTVLNEQIDDGVTLSVNGMHPFLSIRVDPEGPNTGDPELTLFELDAIFGQVTCGVVPADVLVPEPPTPVGPVPATPTFTG